jgi:putative ABC transport system substrate-binding protein
MRQLRPRRGQGEIDKVRRRDFLATAAGAALAWPATAQAQGERVRRVGVLLVAVENDPVQGARNAAFEKRLQELGWTEGRNLRLEYRWAAGDMALIRRYAEELVALAPDAVVALGSNAVHALLQRTRDIPIVFQIVPDPVGQGFIQSHSQPGGNVTGLSTFDDRSMAGKWLETLKELAPGMRRVLFVDNPGASVGWMPPLEAAARALSLELSVATINDMNELESVLTALARRGHAGVIIPPFPYAAAHHAAFAAALATARLPAMWSNSAYVRTGGLVSYGPDQVDLFRRGAEFIDQILRGTRPADIPVQNPTKFELVLNLKTAKTLGLTISPSLLAIADEVIE